MGTMGVHNRNRFYNIFLIYNQVPGNIGTIKLLLRCTLFASSNSINKQEDVRQKNSFRF